MAQPVIVVTDVQERLFGAMDAERRDDMIRNLKILLAAAAFAAVAASADTLLPFQIGANARLPVSPALYSFADVYRLTVSGAAMGDFLVQDGVVRVAVSQPQPAAETQFSIRAVPEPERWLLIVSGLALAAWVARRRLGYST